MQTRFLINIFTCFCLAQANWHCAETSGEGKRKEQIAEGYCECAATIAALDAKAKSMSDSSATLTLMLDSMQQEFEKAEACLVPLRTASGLVTQAELPEIQRILASKCPNLAKNKELLTELLCR